MILDATNQNQAHVKAIAAHYRRKTNTEACSKGTTVCDRNSTVRQKCNAVKRKSIRVQSVLSITNRGQMSDLQMSAMYNICVCLNRESSVCYASKHLRLMANR